MCNICSLQILNRIQTFSRLFKISEVSPGVKLPTRQQSERLQAEGRILFESGAERFSAVVLHSDFAVEMREENDAIACCFKQSDSLNS
jgi:hypothetical protein